MNRRNGYAVSKIYGNFDRRDTYPLTSLAAGNFFERGSIDSLSISLSGGDVLPANEKSHRAIRDTLVPHLECEFLGRSNIRDRSEKRQLASPRREILPRSENDCRVWFVHVYRIVSVSPWISDVVSFLWKTCNSCRPFYRVHFPFPRSFERLLI